MPDPVQDPPAAIPSGPLADGRDSGRTWRRRLKRRIFPALLAGGVLTLMGTGLWTARQFHEQPFVRYNLNRIDAVADRASRQLDPVTVVALGGTALRDSTLDESGMAALAARRGVGQLHFLRIVHNRAEFADFEPLLDRILAIRPTLVLIDRDLMLVERGVGEDLTRTLRALAGLPEGRAFLRDQTALQYRRACGEPAEAEPPMAASADAAERVRAFMARAWAAGIQVALVQTHGRPAPESGPAAGLPLWHSASAAADPAHYCPGGPVGPDGRTAFSAWLAGGVANLLAAPPQVGRPRTEEASLP
ncbi:hypothetical protein [Azospirillum agricola]|uniref:hypothetical protein n=1 Tax=Azospirillum agricola TaxID=1720247 RepID=UPI000A0EF73A|nr:hypothetical protein [Azospirillum agricola]SMH54199.1 hypothetical protein SAMN02982994_3494 [Azospirillum lipoferum]